VNVSEELVAAVLMIPRNKTSTTQQSFILQQSAKKPDIKNVA
jgi:hypothetical protein